MKSQDNKLITGLKSVTSLVFSMWRKRRVFGGKNRPIDSNNLDNPDIFVNEKKSYLNQVFLFLCFLLIVGLVIQTSPVGLAVAQTSISKSTTADWNLGTLTNITTTGNEMKITPRSPWYNTDYSYRRKITFNNSAQAENLQNFPVMVKATNAALSWLSKIREDLYDVVFVDADDTTLLDFEWEKKDRTGESIAWAKVPQIDASSTTDFIYMYYGYASGTDLSDSAGVWSNGYVGVWHLSETSGQHADSTQYGNVSTTVAVSAQGTTGKIGGADDFNGTSNYILIPSSASLQLSANFTISLWAYRDTNKNNYERLVSKSDSQTFDYYAQIDPNTYSNRVAGGYYNTSGSAQGNDAIANGTQIPTGAWSYLGARLSGTTLNSIYNGALERTKTVVGTPRTSTREFLIGKLIDYNFDGKIDEVRISNTDRSTAWLAAEYANQNTPETFNPIGTEEGYYPTTASYYSPTSTAGGSGIIDTMWNGGWGTPNGFTSNVTIPANTSITYQIRSSAVGGSDDGNWTAWADLGTASSTGIFSVVNAAMPNITLGANRYLQVKAAFSTTDGLNTPILSNYTIYYLADVDPPTNPTTTTASKGGSPVTSGTWLNTAGDVNFTFSGAADAESGVAGYYTYFGTSATGDPSTYQAHVAPPGGNQTFTGTAATGNYYYFRVKTKDNSNNVSAAATLFEVGCDTAPPIRPASITADPAGYTTTNSFTFTWPDGSDSGGSGLKWYEYKRAEVDVGWSHTANPTVKTVSGITAYHEGVNEFYVRSVDNASSPSTNYAQVTYYWSGAAPPKPTNLAVAPPAGISNSFTISWDKPAQGPGESPIVGYYYSFNEPPSATNTTYVASTAAHISVGPDAFATQQGDNTVYVVSKNEAGLNSFLPEYYASATFSCQTSAPPIPTSFSAYDSSNKATQTWAITLQWAAGAGQDPATFDHYIIDRSTNGTDFSQIATSTVTSHIDTSGLNDSTTYYYRLKAVDNAGKQSAASSILSLKPSGKYATPPAYIAGPEVTNLKYSEATIKWTTDRTSTTFVRYSVNRDDLKESKGTLDMATNHEITLPGLSGGTTYYYQTQSVDLNRTYSLESAYSIIYSFVTPSTPSISNVSVSNISLDSANISWETTTVTTSKLKYGENTGYGKEVNDISTTSSTKHETKISGLNHSTSYHFKIYATDTDGKELISDDYSFETLPMPIITAAKVARIPDRPTQAVKVIFESNVPISTVVSYSAPDVKQKEESKSKLETTHEVELTDLMDNAKYTITVSGRDQFGNEATGDPLTYETPFDTRAPKISNIQTESSNNVNLGNVDKSQIAVSWQTDEPASSQVLYGTGIGGDYTNKSTEDKTYKTDHLVIISDLTPSTAYHLQVVSADKSNNISKSENVIVVSPEVVKSPLQLILQTIRKAFGWIKL